MPNQPKTVARTVRVEDELWQASLAEAERRGESLSEAVRSFLKRYSHARTRPEVGSALRDALAASLPQARKGAPRAHRAPKGRI